MDELELYDILDYILNRATTSELDAIRAALRRRDSDMPQEVGPAGTGALGIDVRNLALSTAKQIEGQLGISSERVRDIVHGTVRRIIEREAPELDEEQVDELLAGLVSEGASPTGSDGLTSEPPTGDASGTKRPLQTLPKDALVSMIGQFVAYSTGVMSMREEMSLTEQLGKWQHRYWEQFPQVVQRLVSLFIKGAMDGDAFWRGVDDALNELPGS